MTIEAACNRDAVARYDQALKDHDTVLHGIERLYRRYGLLAGFDGLVLDLSKVNRSSIKDLRRQKVLSALFDFWDERCRRLSVTTDPIEGRRGGPLVGFVNTIIPVLTAPARELSGETIFRDLEAYKAARTQD